MESVKTQKNTLDNRAERLRKDAPVVSDDGGRAGGAGGGTGGGTGGGRNSTSAYSSSYSSSSSSYSSSSSSSLSYASSFLDMEQKLDLFDELAEEEEDFESEFDSIDSKKESHTGKKEYHYNTQYKKQQGKIKNKKLLQPTEPGSEPLSLSTVMPHFSQGAGGIDITPDEVLPHGSFKTTDPDTMMGWKMRGSADTDDPER